MAVTDLMPYLVAAGFAAAGTNTLTVNVGANSGSFGQAWPVLPGDLIIVSGGVSTAVPTGISDSQGNTYTLVSSNTTNAATWMFTAVAGAHGLRTDTPDTITATYAATTQTKTMVVTACPSMATSALDSPSVVTAVGTSAAPSITSGALAGVGNGGNGELVVAVLTSPSTSGPPTWGTGWTPIGTTHNASSTFVSVAVANKTGTAGVTASATISSSQAWTMIIAAFKPATVSKKDLVGASVFTSTYSGSNTRLQNSATFDGFADAGSAKVRKWAQQAQKIYFNEDTWPTSAAMGDFDTLTSNGIYVYVAFRGKRAVGGGTTTSRNSLVTAVTLYKNYLCANALTAKFMIFPWNEAGGNGSKGDFGDGTSPSKGAITGYNPYTTGPNSVTEPQAATNYAQFHAYYCAVLCGNAGMGGCGVPVGYNGQGFSPNSSIDFFPGRPYCNGYCPDYYTSDYTGVHGTTLANGLSQASGTMGGTTVGGISQTFSPPLPVGIPEMGLTEGGTITVAQFDDWIHNQLVGPLLNWINQGNYILPTVWYTQNPTGGNAVTGATPALELTDLQWWWDSLNPPASGAVQITTTSLPNATQGSSYTDTLAATGGTTPYTWQASGLPAGLSCSSAGVISGTATTSGTFSVQVTVTDHNGVQAINVLSLLVIATGPTITTTSPLPPGAQNAAYTDTLTATGGTAPYTWSLAAGTLPPGMTLTGAGVLSGTPFVPGSYSFTVQVTDAHPLSAQLTLTLVIATGLQITTQSVPNGTVGIPYTATFTATEGVLPYSWSAPGSANAGNAQVLPPGLGITSSGNLTGTPTLAGNYTFTVAVTDSQGSTVTATFSISIAAAPPSPFDSLIIADQIELLGGSPPSTNPKCAGAIFRLQPSYDLGAPQPTTDIVGSLILDGERPFGYRASNRTITLPIQIDAPDFDTLAGAYEALMEAVDQQQWTLTWTRKDNNLPLVLDCFRAQPTVVQWGGADQWNINPVGQLSLTFQALPYGRSDEPLSIAVASPLPAQPGQQPPVVLDNFSTVSGNNWVQSTRHVTGPSSARWNPCLSPLNDCTGRGSQPGALYSATLPAPVNILGLTALSVQAGFGSDYFETWHHGPALFAFSLTDSSGNTISFSRSLTVHASDDSAAPKWQRVTAPIPQGIESFDYGNVAAYSVLVTNRKVNTLRYVNLYLDALTANPPSTVPVAPVRGAMYAVFGVQGTARTPVSAQFQQPPGSAPQTTVILPGPPGSPQTWICPPGVTTVKAECTGAAAAGGSYSGPGGGEYAAEANVAVTALKQYTYTIAAAGQPVKNTIGQPASGPSVFTGDTQTVTANSGSAPANATTGGLGGTGSTNTTHFSGGNGAAGSSGTGGGGGGSAGSGGAGGNASGSTGGTAGIAGTGGTPGAAGGNGATTDRDGFPSGGPGAGGGGPQDTDNLAGQSGNGQIKLTYTSSVAPFSTLIVHRPGPAAPADLAPLVTFGLTDVPNGNTEYPVPSQTAGVYAQFGGTYTVVVVANAWNSPSASRTLTITVKQYEYAGGPSYSTSVSRTFTPNSDITNGIVVLGELTLPLKDIAPDNSSGLFTITITDTNTADTFLDALFLDTLGQVVLVNIATAGAYPNFYVDAPDPDRDLGRVMGSTFDRGQAISVLDNAIVSGGPLVLEPGDNMLLVYAVEGAPALSVSYFARWWLDRLS